MRDVMDLRSDTDVMETDSASAAATATAAETQQHLRQGQDVDLRELLALARQLINQGRPSQALQAVINHFFFLNFLCKKKKNCYDCQSI